MNDLINQFLERVADALARHPGLLLFVAIGFVLFNFVLQIIPGTGYWIVDSNLFLHVGLVIGFIGILLIRPLG
jgi:hypothetical protein